MWYKITYAKGSIEFLNDIDPVNKSRIDRLHQNYYLNRGKTTQRLFAEDVISIQASTEAEARSFARG